MPEKSVSHKNELCPGYLCHIAICLIRGEGYARRNRRVNKKYRYILHFLRATPHFSREPSHVLPDRGLDNWV